MFTFRTWLWISTRHQMGGILQYISVFIREVGFKSSKKWVKTGLVVQLPCLVSGVITALHSTVKRQNLFSRCATATQLHPKNFYMMGRLSHSSPFCEWYIGVAFLGLSWAASTASHIPNPKTTLCTWHWPSVWLWEDAKEMCNNETEWVKYSPQKIVEGILQKEYFCP